MLAFSDDVTGIIREVAAEEIMPRFNNLLRSEVTQKRHPGDLVTVADVSAERRLTEALSTLVPGSAVVGEEACDADPETLRLLAGSAPVWLIDPVDGTSNFVHGRPCFAVIVAYCEHGATVAGWIHDPVAGVTVVAGCGAGAWLIGADGARTALRLDPPRGIGSMRGSLGWRTGERLQAKRAVTAEPLPSRIVRYGSTGREYMALAQGGLDFAQYTRLKPWDHAAGVLIHAEAGGVGLLRGVRAPYRPEPHIVEATLLLAPTEATWYSLERLIG